MKRALDVPTFSANINPSFLAKHNSPHSLTPNADHSFWTQDQDNMLIANANLCKKNWKTIAKEHNKLFPNSHKTPKECKLRFEKLDTSINQYQPWSLNEDVLLIYLYECESSLSKMDVLFPGKNAEQRLTSFLLETAQKAKQKMHMCLRDMSPFSLLKALFSLKLLLMELSSSLITDPIAHTVLQITGVTTSECLSLFTALTPCKKVPGPVWTPESAIQHVQGIIEKIANRIRGYETDVDPEICELFHGQKDDDGNVIAQNPVPRQETVMDVINFGQIQASYYAPLNMMYGYPCFYYCLSVYYVDSYVL